VSELDVLIIGSGVAGLSVAVRLAEAGMAVGVATKAHLSDSATQWAQGGVAAAIDLEGDSVDLHLDDTLIAGAGLCDRDAVRILVEEGPRRVEELIGLGAVFDREASGSLARAREGGHSRARVLHAGGVATGAEVQKTLVEATRASVALIAEGCFALDLAIGEDGIEGVSVLADGARDLLRARHVVLATGGAGQLYSVTTNPKESTADGLAMALRASVAVADVEFIQFHPTALHHPSTPRPLLSEALRGHGALLRNAKGDRFVDELAPRDVVSRAMAATMEAEGVEHCWLDVTVLEHFAQRFPTLATTLTAAGFDPTVDWLPVAPAAHHLAGGVMTDIWGATILDGLWAVGEVADVGVHGANRLASNSLLEGLVFGARLAEALSGGQREPTETGVLRGLFAPSPGVIPAVLLPEPSPEGSDEVSALREDSLMPSSSPRSVLQAAMTEGAGVVRTADSLLEARRTVRSLVAPGPATTAEDAELANLATAADAVLSAALFREESRGGHFRADFPVLEEAWECRIVHRGAHR